MNGFRPSAALWGLPRLIRFHLRNTPVPPGAWPSHPQPPERCSPVLLNIERVDCLVQSIAASKNMQSDVLDEITALVDAKLSVNRQAA